MEKMEDRTVLVPVEPTDIMDSINRTLLPRSLEESAVVSVDFKRMKNMKNTHKSGGIRPVKLVKLPAYFKDCENQYYQNVIVQCSYCQRKFEQNEKDVLDHIEKCHLNDM